MGKAIAMRVFACFRLKASGRRMRRRIREKVLTGYYDLVDFNHGKPVYKRVKTTHRDREVYLHYWAGGGSPQSAEDVGWWFGSRIGSNDVWAFHDQDSLEPPSRGWLFLEPLPGDGNKLELVVEPRDEDEGPAFHHHHHNHRSARKRRSWPSSGPLSKSRMHTWAYF